MNKLEKYFIAYEGEEFTIEWYFDAKGKSQALEYYQEMSKTQKATLVHLFFILGSIDI
jgi:hypothetical protein